MSKIIDVFPFFAPTNEQILYTRVNLLKDQVDKFVIIESDKTHSGEPVQRKFLEIARNQGLPMEKIIYVEHDIPEEEDLEILPIDRKNAGSNRGNIKSVYARVRERLQKDALRQVYDKFDDDDVFIYGDADEIIDPKHIKWVANVCRNSPTTILKIPLVYLQGRADLRIHNPNGKPVPWWRAMFFATKNQIWNCGGVNNIRCGNIKWDIRWPTLNGEIVQDMGWHLAWMGTNEQRDKKAKSFAHAFDKFKWMKTLEGYEGTGYKKFVQTNDPVEGGPAPDGDPNHILRRYDVNKLPSIIRENDYLKDFFLPETDIMKEFSFNECKCYWCNTLNWPLLYDLDGEKSWFEIPRSGSVTIKESFSDRKQVFRGTEEYEEIKQREKPPVVIFSEPVERFLSCMNVYIVPGQRYYDYGKDIFASFGVDLDECSKEEKIDYFFKNLHKIVSHHQVHHFHPQTSFIDFENFDLFSVITRHEIGLYFGISKHMNKTKKEVTLEDLSQDQLDFIKWVYRSDYEFFEKYG